ncbi:hypothetical protein ADUPG1_011556, partial [Aduncisulcus paluster]
MYEVVPYFFYNDRYVVELGYERGENFFDDFECTLAEVKKKAKSYGLTPDSPGEIVIVVITARKTMHAIGPEYDWENEAYEPFSYEYVSWPESFLETVSHDAVWSTRGENHSFAMISEESSGLFDDSVKVKAVINIPAQTRTIEFSMSRSSVGVIRANEKAGLILTHAEAPERGEYLGNCEGCGMPIFSEDVVMSKTLDLAEIREELRTQDNLFCAHPLYTVQEKNRTHGFDPLFTEHGETVWIDIENGCEEVDLEKMGISEADAEEKGYLQKTGFQDKWEFVNAHFTYKAAEEYIKKFSHRHKGDLTVFVSSMHNSPEMIAIRKALLEGQLFQLDWKDASEKPE